MGKFNYSLKLSLSHKLVRNEKKVSQMVFEDMLKFDSREEK